jgi:D-sedoheptulose 7-phosphate isomerase
METINHYFQCLSSIANYKMDDEAISKAADMIFEAWKTDNTVYIAGNGGSYCNAQHMALDLSKHSGVRAVALGSPAFMTAWANDDSYGDIFLRELSPLYRPGDLFIAISCSGKSKNILKAMSFVDGQNGKQILLTGDNERSPAAKTADVVISVKDSDIRRQEDIHLAVAHCIAGIIRERIEEEK